MAVHCRQELNRSWSFAEVPETRPGPHACQEIGPCCAISRTGVNYEWWLAPRPRDHDRPGHRVAKEIPVKILIIDEEKAFGDYLTQVARTRGFDDIQTMARIQSLGLAPVAGRQ